MKVTIRTLATALLLLSGHTWAMDPAREARIAEQIADSILEGETVWLQAGSQRFMAIHTPASTPTTTGAVILLHGFNAHPDWPEVIHPLRTRLPASGWETLSIQLPVNATDAPPSSWQSDMPLAAVRITAASRWLQQTSNNFNQVLIGHSLGARMGVEYVGNLHGTPDPAIRAFVAVSLTADPGETEGGTLLALKQLRVPVLDVYGERDFGGVLQSTEARKRAVLRGRADGYHPAFDQAVIPGADHFYNGSEDWLFSRIRSWLARTAEGFEVSTQ